MFFSGSMDPEQLYYRRKFNHALEPIKVMLVHKRKKLALSTWLGYVNLTRDRVLVCPHEYLGDQLPAAELLTRIVRDIFSDFVKAQA